MPYNESLAQRVREALAGTRKVQEKKMMGGLTFMVDNKMALGILRDDLMVRFDPAAHDDALRRTGSREMDFPGRPMRGFIFVGPDGTRLKRDLDHWVEMALAYNKIAKASKKSGMKRTNRT
jgi:TfoX/Sxy family transcriptional regulator of competence genes